MAAAENMILAAGTLAFVGSFKEEGGFPENGYAVIGGTTALVFLASTQQNTVIAGPVKGMAGLMLLVSAIRYIPVLNTRNTSKKRKKNG